VKITDVETSWVRIESPEPQGLLGGCMRYSADGLCRITTDDGIRGIGEGRGAALEEMIERHGKAVCWRF
jgi:L-alanine-DL-glutamate epimerase-like enolase superfamily enzyme